MVCEEPMKIACLFPGYGSQFIGMAKELYDESRVIQEYFEQAGHCLDTNFIKLCFASSDAELGQMEHAYTANFLVSCALFGLLKDQGFEPDLVAGLNQGEYAALYAAKSFEFPDGLYLLSKYAAFYTQMLSTASYAYAMTQSRGLSLKKVSALCKKITLTEGEIFIAISLSATIHTVAGTTQAIDAFRKLVLLELGATVDDQPLELGMHSLLMDPVVDQLKMYLEKVDFKDPQIPFINTVRATSIAKGNFVKKHILNNINMPLRWDKVVDALYDYDVVVQIGPGTDLISLVLDKYPEKRCIAINKKADVQELLLLIAPSAIEREIIHDDELNELSE